jgi:hypothetical protein
MNWEHGFRRAAYFVLSCIWVITHSEGSDLDPDFAADSAFGLRLGR